VRFALESGINLFDTAAGYGDSEEILGRALVGVPRDSYVLSTKFAAGRAGATVNPEKVVASVNRSLKRLRVDTIDLVQFHGPSPERYRECDEILLPVLTKLKQEGKFRSLGVTESYNADTRHEMIPMAIEREHVESIMVGYNLLGPVPERTLLPACAEKGVGVICMVPVRRALARPEHLRIKIADAKARDIIAPDALPDQDPLGWLLHGDVKTLPAAAYKYVAAHPAVHTVLTGTADLDHLKENIKAVLGPPLPAEDMARLRSVFKNVREPLAG